MKNALSTADAVMDWPKRIVLSERDGLAVIELLENPPRPNARLLAAAKALPVEQQCFPVGMKI